MELSDNKTLGKENMTNFYQILIHDKFLGTKHACSIFTNCNRVCLVIWKTIW